MSAIVFCNIGTRDVILTDPTDAEKTLTPRQLGRKLLAEKETRADKIQFPIIQKVLEYVLLQVTSYIDHIVFIGTDQTSKKFRPRDTCHFAKLAADLIPTRYPRGIGQAHPVTVGKKPPIDPSLYDQAFEVYGPLMQKFVSDEEATCCIFPTGGIPACNTALILQGVRLFSERCHIFYQSEGGQAIPLQVGAKVLGILRENAIKRALERYDFAAACSQLEESDQPQPLGQALLKYARARLHFDFDLAARHLQAAKTALSQQDDLDEAKKEVYQANLDDIDRNLAILQTTEEPSQLEQRHQAELARIGELYHNARIAWDSERYVDFLGRLIRFQGAVLRYQLKTIYQTVTLDDTAFKSLAIQDDLRQLLLLTLDEKAASIPPTINTEKAKTILPILRKLINSYFDQEEIADLSFDMGIDLQNITAANANKGGQIRDLLSYADRHDRLAELIATAQEHRPQITWPQELQLTEPSLPLIAAALRRIDSLVTLRNKSIIGHGYQGVSEAIIMRDYYPSAESERATPIEDMAIICRALNLSTRNPFRHICTFILEIL